jgi:hypothetical protein
MNYWIIWPVGISLWLLLGWIAFAYFESRALRHGARKNEVTLSMFLYTIGSKFPLSIFVAGLLAGLFVGGLAVHVLWHWCPNPTHSYGLFHITLLDIANLK